MHPTEPNVRTCHHCGEPYVAEWIDLSQHFVGNSTIAVSAGHSPCPARPEPQAAADNDRQENP